MVALLLGAALAGCAPLPSGAASATGTQAATAALTSAPSATPLAARFSELTLKPGDAPDAWIANGLVTNDSTSGASGLQLKLSLLDAEGETLAAQEIAPVVDRLGPGETSPFTAHFTGAPNAVRFRAEVTTSRGASFQRAPITVEALQATGDSSGGISVIGTLTNAGNRPAAVAQVAIAARDSGKLIAVGEREAGMSYVRPGESVPFLAHLSASASGAQLAAWVDAVEISTPDPLPTAVTASARVATTSQGLPFVVGSVRNHDSAYRTASLVVSLKAKSQVLGLADIELPIPLAPGEAALFAAASFSGLSARMASGQVGLADLTAEVVFDPVASGAAPAGDYVPLDVSITAYEPIGSTLFLKGQVTNDRSTVIQSPAVVVSVRSTDGKPVTAGYLIAAPQLRPGETAGFSLALPLPSGVDPAMAEYDLKAAGFPAR